MDIIDLFMDYTEDTGSCRMYRKWAAITMIGGAMERRIQTVIGKFLNYGHLYVMLVGPPTCGKGIINQVEKMWRGTTNTNGTGQPMRAFHVAGKDYTKAALVDALKEAGQFHPQTSFKYHSLLCPFEEFSTTYARQEQDFLPFLTAMYNTDPVYEERRRTGGKIIIDNPIMTILCGYQPNVMDRALMQDSADQGFLRRTMLIWNEIPDIPDLTNAQPYDTKIEKLICERLGEISTLAGLMSVDTEVVYALDDWWRIRGGPPRPTEPRLDSYSRTRQQFVIKLCMIASLSESANMHVSSHHLERAFDWLFEAEELMPQIFDYMTGNSEWSYIKAFNSTALKEQSAGRPITSEFVFKWWLKKLPPHRINSVVEKMCESGMMVLREDKTWRMTGKGP